MKKVIELNPAYVEAKYEVVVYNKSGAVNIPYPVRFNKMCPVKVMQNDKLFAEFLKRYTIPPFIEISI